MRVDRISSRVLRGETLIHSQSRAHADEQPRTHMGMAHILTKQVTPPIIVRVQRSIGMETGSNSRCMKALVQVTNDSSATAYVKGHRDVKTTVSQTTVKS